MLRIYWALTLHHLKFTQSYDRNTLSIPALYVDKKIKACKDPVTCPRLHTDKSCRAGVQLQTL